MKKVFVILMLLFLVGQGQTLKTLYYNKPNSQITIIYGYLYNYYVIEDARNITASGWHVPTKDEYITMLVTHIGGTESGGLVFNSSPPVRETGTVYWDANNTDATNAEHFNLRGGGFRDYLATFSFITARAFLGTSTHVTDKYTYFSFMSGQSFCAYQSMWNTYGTSLRLVKDATSLTDGQTGTYIGNDGKTYPTICIGTQEWLAVNLCETKYRNGDLVTVVTDGDAWPSLTTEARCSYNNDDSNAFIP